MDFRRYFLLPGMVALSVVGCSLETPELSGGGLRIILENAQKSQVAAPLLDYLQLASGNPSINIPTSADNFSCFTANVTGGGIQPDNKLHDCISPNNMNGRGFGILAPPFLRGASAQMDVPAGTRRTIDVYGIDPASAVRECTGVSSGQGSAGGYLLGSKTVDLKESATVVIPISFTSGTPATFMCAGHVTVPLTDAGSTACTTYAGGAPSIPVPTVSIIAGTPFTGGDISEVLQNNNTPVFKECVAGGPSQGQITEFRFDVSGFDLSLYQRVRVIWAGRAGNYTGGVCTSSTGVYSSGGGSVWIYRHSDTSWTQIGSPTSTSTAIQWTEGIAPNPSTMPMTSNMIHVRVVSPSSTTNDCATTNTDFIQLKLE